MKVVYGVLGAKELFVYILVKESIQVLAIPQSNFILDMVWGVIQQNNSNSKSFNQKMQLNCNL